MLRNVLKYSWESGFESVSRKSVKMSGRCSAAQASGIFEYRIFASRPPVSVQLLPVYQEVALLGNKEGYAVSKIKGGPLALVIGLGADVKPPWAVDMKSFGGKRVEKRRLDLRQVRRHKTNENETVKRCREFRAMSQLGSRKHSGISWLAAYCGADDIRHRGA